MESNGHLQIADAVDFPNPVIVPCAIQLVNVQVGERIPEKRALVSSSGSAYEIGRHIRGAIFGEVSAYLYCMVKTNEEYY